MIAIINRRVKRIEKHLDIKIVYQGEKNQLELDYGHHLYGCIRVTNENHNPIQTSILHYQNFIFPMGFGSYSMYWCSTTSYTFSGISNLH